MTLRAKVILLVGVCLAGLALTVIVASVYEMRALSRQAELQASASLGASINARVEESVRSQTASVQAFFADTLRAGEQAAAEIERVVTLARKLPQEEGVVREHLTAQVRSLLDANPALLSSYVVFLPDALDGRDAAFVGLTQSGSNEQGRFAPVWFRQGPQTLEQVAAAEKTLVDETPMTDGRPARTWFDCPLRTQAACLLSPYLDSASGQALLLTSLTVPVRIDGKVVAVLGVDILLEQLQVLAQRAQRALPGQDSVVWLLSSANLVAATTADASVLGQPWQAPDKTVRADGLQDIHAEQAFQPITGAQPWNVRVQVPAEQAFEPITSLQRRLNTQLQRSIRFELVLGVVASLLGLALMAFASRAIVNPLRGMAAMVDELGAGEGDLSRRINYVRQDELGALSRGINHFLDVLQPIIASIKAAMQVLNTAAVDSVQGVHANLAATEQQRGDIDHVATAMQQMRLSAHEVARNTASASSATDGILRTIEDGTDLIDRTTAIVALQGVELAATNEQVKALSLKSERIGVVLSLIRGIAEQTNLLALNAAIEAARAGDQGRGFAVVADEVRGLAQRTQNSIQEIHSIIEALQGDMHAVVRSMAINQQQVSETGQLFAELVESLYSVGSAVVTIAEMNGQIASAAEEQSAVAEHINTAVERIRSVSDELTRSARVSAQQTRAIDEQVATQVRLLSRFRV
ncbi:methyl-accepting chemotaxis protein [Pseudomonas cuatrocienegasensis]|uniref:Methyl-accepting chemotaxis protein n=1 Tax=Pseudomonas cuatrocienegasensis TaxID=543360 RepID=A0ABY1B4L2_9PSED|nr:MULTISPECIES: methyl-accepting chemotaxis protein [Pseudomonas]OEC37252.1 hypothetical protein A7D25_00880 [Pseudomonas sp. 21C1]SEP90542.1 methyl-accepting chemotaxis protein [Pseudomonas cuatrocienegasensis]